MQIDTKNLVSISEANQNFSRVAKIVDEKGAVVILKNNVPKYVLVEYDKFENEISDDEVLKVADKILSKNLKAFEELAK